MRAAAEDRFTFCNKRLPSHFREFQGQRNRSVQAHSNDLNAYVEERRSRRARASGRRASRLYLTRHVSRESASRRDSYRFSARARELHIYRI